jgi:tetratricopeptide (TPR) repeat protein
MYFKYFLLTTFVSGCLISQELPGDVQLKKGVMAMYNYEYTQAIILIDSVRNTCPEHPGAPMIWVGAKWLKAQANLPTEQSMDTLEKCLNDILPIYESLVKKYPSDPIYQLYYGSAKGLSARISLGEKKWLQTLMRAYGGFTMIQKAYEDDPDLNDALLPFGIVEYYAGISPKIIRWLVDFYGLNPSTDSGLAKMEITTEKSEWAWIEAKGILSFLYLWVEDKPSWALRHTEDLTKKFSNNYYFYLLHLESLIRTGNKSEAEHYLKMNDGKFEKLTDRQKRWYFSYGEYEKALFDFTFENSDNALDYLEYAIKDYDAELDIILGNAYLLKGKIHDLKKQRKDAISAYQKCIELDNFSSAMKKANTYLLKPFSP